MYCMNRLGEDTELDFLHRNLETMVVSDPLLHDGAQDAGTIVDRIVEGHDNITRDIDSERLVSINR